MAKNLDYILTTDRDSDTENLTVYVRPHYDQPHQADSSHFKWEEIKAGVLADDPAVVDLINIAETLQRELISERVAVAAGRLYFDGDEVSDDLANYIVKLMSEDNPNYQAFVNFLEKLYSNPQEHSREHLFSHVKKYNMSITPDGDLILYKGLNRRNPTDDNPARYQSGTAGPAIINGLPHKQGKVPQDVGDVVELPRTATWSNPTAACSTGLHVACWGYWHTSYHVNFVVLVNPRDVVGVPHDDSKIRCCRYRIVGIADGPVGEAVADVYLAEDGSDQAIVSQVRGRHHHTRRTHREMKHEDLMARALDNSERWLNFYRMNRPDNM